MLVSVIIPCHNCALTIVRAVNSVFIQTYENWELILVNNNSTDNTWEKLNEIKEQNPGKTITIFDEKKKGAPAARNKGLYVAKGEWIQFLDADDELELGKIEKQVEVIKKSDIDVIYSPFYKVKLKDNEIIKNKIEIEHDFWKGLIKSNVGITSANLFKAKTVIKVNGWDETKTSSQEYDLMFRIAQENGVFLSYNSPMTNIYFEENSISNLKNKKSMFKRLKNFTILRTQMIWFLERNNQLNKEYKKLYNDTVSLAFILNFRANPSKVFFNFNQIDKITLRTKIKTNWTFLKLTIRIIFKSLPE